MGHGDLGVTITQGPADWAILQQENGYATLTLEGTWSVGADVVTVTPRVFLRVVAEEDGRDVVPWMPCTMHETRPEWTGVLARVPAGGLYRVESCLQYAPDVAIEWALRGDMIHHLGVGDLWVIAGQSNAAGYGRGTVYDPPEAGIHLYRNNGRWDMAAHPFNESTGTAHVENRETANPGHSPYLAFARTIRREMGFPIGLLPTALGGSPLSAWHPEQDGTLSRVMLQVIGSLGGRVRGILWYQGESDATPADCATYLARFRRMVELWRAALGDAALPVLTVQLNRYTEGPATEDDNRAWGTLREAQRQAARTVPGVYVVPSLDCPLSDAIHTSPAGNMMLGERLARVALAAVYGRAVKHRAPNMAGAAVGEDTAEGQPTLLLRFEDVEGSLLAIGLQEAPFRVGDAQGEVGVLRWQIEQRAAIRLVLARRPTGQVRVHGASEVNPAFLLPMDTATYLPMLAFYDVAVDTAGGDDA
jgi:hypothetical protein